MKRNFCDKMFYTMHKRFEELNTMYISTIEFEWKNGFWVFYFYETDDMFIVKWNEWYGDIEEFIIIDNDEFVDFAGTRDTEFSQDHWNYSNESVYQTYSKMEIKEYINEYGEEEMKDMINSNDIFLFKRNFKDRSKRLFNKLITKIKRTIKWNH
jgi:hypothetical protein